jgi:hypothetical protein
MSKMSASSMLPAVLRRDQLRRDADALAHLPHAALDKVAYAERRPDLARVDLLAAVSIGRMPREHGKPAIAPEKPDDVFGQAIGEILVLRVVAQIGEG